MKLNDIKIRKLLDLIREQKDASLDAVGDGFVVTTDQGLKYTVEKKDETGITVSYSDLAGNFKVEKISFEKFKSLFKKSGTKKKEDKNKKNKVVTDD